MAPLASSAAAQSSGLKPATGQAGQRGTVQRGTGTAQAAGTDAGTTQRGTTTIPAKVVAKIAAEAAYETGNVGSNAGGVLGIGARRNFSSRPEAQCELYGQVAVLHMNLGLVFPTPLADTIEAVRTHVRSRVEHLTGLSVGKINIEISWLNPAGPGRKNLK
ncbi:hypothetical protein HMPREF0045_00958 [Actinomyces graevenitzii C83]|uniref:Asp23/Gls24 family envelope stress response protein n=1 Tax=Actinomyces graevenitzii C83 TaxID=435830 RepID=G9PFD4_9ACTO|nr:Asp23/Gls24 family envelope stress response protein [Actinomyces graevenitzii]EHM88745.1 hypothetical protein HMPREF0045_00958 [Actinomyces graevenitzii C83]